MHQSTWRSLGVVAAGIAIVVAVATLSNRDAQAQSSATARRVPVFEVDPDVAEAAEQLGAGPGPRRSPSTADDHVWILHRPRTVPRRSARRPRRRCSSSTRTGKFVHAWGGPGPGFDWPDSEHGISVDYKDNVWIGGSSPTSHVADATLDDMLLKFTSKGKFLLQIGGPDKSGGNTDTRSVNKPADAFVYPKTNELFVADGYGNRRVIVFDAGHRCVQAHVGRIRQRADRRRQPAGPARPGGRGAAASKPTARVRSSSAGPCTP